MNRVIAEWDEGVDAGCCSVPPRPRCLCGKARYATEGEARRAVKRMKSNGRSHSYAGLLHPYMCPERKGIWHVGHTDE
jgi:hypothetical protein